MKLTQSSKGFTVAELMMVVAIIGILTGLTIDAGLSDWRRQQVNAVAVELAGWLEAVRRAALKGNQCSVELQLGTGLSQDLAGGATLATSTCAGASALQISTITPGQAFRVQATSRAWSFSPLGTLHLPEVDKKPVVISVSLKDGNDPVRCVQLDGLMGVISIGRTTSSQRTSCTIDRRF